jgi:hypothetical protein
MWQAAVSAIAALDLMMIGRFELAWICRFGLDLIKLF